MSVQSAPSKRIASGDEEKRGERGRRERKRGGVKGSEKESRKTIQ
jgi:hypothetical protein